MALRHLTPAATAQRVPSQQGARPSPVPEECAGEGGCGGAGTRPQQSPGRQGPSQNQRALGEGLGAQRAKLWNCFDVLRDGAWGPD